MENLSDQKSVLGLSAEVARLEGKNPETSTPKVSYHLVLEYQRVKLQEGLHAYQCQKKLRLLEKQ